MHYGVHDINATENQICIRKTSIVHTWADIEANGKKGEVVLFACFVKWKQCVGSLNILICCTGAVGKYLIKHIGRHIKHGFKIKRKCFTTTLQC